MLIWRDPHLQEVHRFSVRMVIFTVRETRTSRGELYTASGNYFHVTHRVLVFKESRDNIRKDLKVAMRYKILLVFKNIFEEIRTVSTKTLARLHPVFIENAQRTEAFKFWIVIHRKGEGVVGIQPVVVSVAAVSTPPNSNRHVS